MKPKKKVERAIRTRLRFTAGPMLRDRLLTDVMNAREEFKETRPALHEAGIRRRIMRSPITKLASLAAVIALAALGVLLWTGSGTPAYAIEQTVEALQNVQFLHIIGHDDAGQINDERWIEIGDDGYQVRYRQQNPPSVLESHPGAPSMVIEDGESTAVYRSEKKAVILYDRNERQYQWVGQLGKAFENLRQEGKILQENAEYQGRPAHKVWWPYMHAECYVDPTTKLPMSIGNTELSYEQPPVGIFEITIPDGYAVLDKRPGAVVGSVPDWLLEEESASQNRGENFREGTAALIRGDYAEAVKRLEQGLGADSWATFWLGSAYYGRGLYDQAAVYYGKMLQDFGGDTKPVPFCNYALGMAQAKGGHHEVATTNFQICLPAMIETLRIPSSGQMFEYADNPKIRYGQHKPTDQEMVVKMINRLRLITGKNFGYDLDAPAENREAAITAWEEWFKTDGRVQFSPRAEQLTVPEPAEEKVEQESPIGEWVNSVGYGRKSNQEIASKYSSDWLEQIKTVGPMFKCGLALYDVGRYQEALAAFEQMEKKTGNDTILAIALIWQAQMLDLLGTRDRAVAIYQKVVNMKNGGVIRHDQFGMAYSPSVYAAERIATPFVRVENRDEN